MISYAMNTASRRGSYPLWNVESGRFRFCVDLEKEEIEKQFSLDEMYAKSIQTRKLFYTADKEVIALFVFSPVDFAVFNKQ